MGGLARSNDGRALPSVDTEAAEPSFFWLPAQLQVVDPGPVGSPSAPFDRRLDRCFIAFEQRFHTAIRIVADPASQMQLLGSVLGALPEPDPLNPAPEFDSSPLFRHFLPPVPAMPEIHFH